jgi:hypothetical protein
MKEIPYTECRTRNSTEFRGITTKFRLIPQNYDGIPLNSAELNSRKFRGIPRK